MIQWGYPKMDGLMREQSEMDDLGVPPLLGEGTYTATGLVEDVEGKPTGYPFFRPCKMGKNHQIGNRVY